MSISAAVFVENTGKVVRINDGGAPSSMIHCLEYLVEANLLESFTSAREYAFIVSSGGEYEMLIDALFDDETYLWINQVGCAYHEENAPIELYAALDENKVPQFFYTQSDVAAEENYHYMIDLDGKVTWVGGSDKEWL